MNFDLIRPCAHCPFRNDRPGFLRVGRARSIVRAMTEKQQTFACHETVEYDDDGEYAGPQSKEQHCAGALIFLSHIGKLYHIQLVRIASRLRMFDESRLDMGSPVFRSLRSFLAHQEKE